MIKANYHTHLVYCNHAVGHAKDYIESAIRNNFDEIGITDHAPVLESFMTKEEYKFNWCFQAMKLDTLYTKYLPEVREAKKTYSDKIKVLIGFEVEYLPDNLYYIKKLRKEVDYLNLGVHFFMYEGKCLNSYYSIDTKTIYGYLNMALEAMETGFYNTLVHPDLFMFSYKDKDGNRLFDEHCERVSRALIEGAIKNNMYIEINANGLKNSQTYCTDGDWLYPDRNFWRIAKEYPEVKIIIGADAHDPSHLANENVKKVICFAKELGLTVCEHMKIYH